MTNRQLFDKTFSAWLARCTTRDIGVCDVPSTTPNMPYGVYNPINSPRGEGSWQDPEDERDWVFQITCVGRSPEQVGWMSDKVDEVIVGRNDRGYATAMTGVQGGTVLWRLTDSKGTIVRSGQLFQVVDTYRIRVKT